MTDQRTMDIEGLYATCYRLDRLGEHRLAREVRDLYQRLTGKEVPA